METATVMILTKGLYKKIDLTMVLTGALAGVVSIAAQPLTPTMGQAAPIGAFNAGRGEFAVPLFDRVRIDDVAGALPRTWCAASGHPGRSPHQHRYGLPARAHRRGAGRVSAWLAIT
jgi:hypothetical protein